MALFKKHVLSLLEMLRYGSCFAYRSSCAEVKSVMVTGGEKWLEILVADSACGVFFSVVFLKISNNFTEESVCLIFLPMQCKALISFSISLLTHSFGTTQIGVEIKSAMEINFNKYF
jgi:hypothetical protein